MQPQSSENTTELWKNGTQHAETANAKREWDIHMQ